MLTLSLKLKETDDQTEVIADLQVEGTEFEALQLLLSAKLAIEDRMYQLDQEIVDRAVRDNHNCGDPKCPFDGLQKGDSVVKKILNSLHDIEEVERDVVQVNEKLH